jgi:lipopolysaccharide transport system ATP-binding protein
MSDHAIDISGLGKMYKLYRRPVDKVLDALGANRLLFWRTNYYQEFWALRDLNLRVARGERLGIIGRNGAGKSTTLKVITGNIAPTEGTVDVNGRVQALLELGTGFHPEFTGRQNIRASLAYQGLSAAGIAEKEDEIIEFAELEEFIDQPVKTYSAGMYARLAFSTATAIEPEVLIIDEVLGAGDAYFAGKCVERMKRLTERFGATVLFVSHDLGSVQQLCERVIWIDRGRVVMDGSPLDVTKAYYASILQQEEVRLRARNARLGRGQVKQLQTREDTEHIKEVLLRFVTNSGAPPSQAHPIREITLRCGAWSETISPGGPMDNDASQAAYLMTDPKYMLWSEPRLVDGQRVRCITATGGQYGHAPMVFGVPSAAWQGGEAIVEVEHAAVAGDTINVEYFDGQSYQILGSLISSHEGMETQTLSMRRTDASRDGSLALPSGSRTQSKKSQVLAHESADVVLRQRDSEKFYSDFAEFISIHTVDDMGRSQVMYQVRDRIGVTVEIEVRQWIRQCHFGVSIYSLSDVVIGTFTWPIEAGLCEGRYRWEVHLQNPNLRQNTFLLSCALIESPPRATNENLVYFCRWNRAVTFKIDEGLIGNVPHGLIALETSPPAGSALTVTSFGPAASVAIEDRANG